MSIKGFKSRDGSKHKYDYEALENIPENDTVTDEQISAVVEKYLTENPVDGVTDQQVYDAVAAYLTENPVEGVTDEQIAQAVNDYLVENPPASGDPGKDGGYYTPGVTQLDDETIQFDFSPSKEDMPTVDPVQVKLPIPDSSQNGNGLTTAQINALHGMFKVCLFDDSKDVDGAISAFETAFGITGGGEEPDTPVEPETKTYSVTYELVNVSSNNSVARVAEGASYSATLTAADGFTLEGATVSITMGGAEITDNAYADGVISIASVTGNVEIMASAVLAEQKEPELNTDGLLSFFNLRNAAADLGDGIEGYYTPATIGDGRLYSWSNRAAGDDYGKRMNSTEYCHGSSYTAYDFGTEYTWISKQYSNDQYTVVCDANHTVPTNTGTKIEPMYNAADGTGNAGSTVPSKRAAGYHTMVITVSGNTLLVYIDSELVANYDGADIDGFVSWYSKFKAGTAYAGTNYKVTAMAFYNRALSGAEIVEMNEYLKTLEVSA